MGCCGYRWDIFEGFEVYGRFWDWSSLWDLNFLRISLGFFGISWDFKGLNGIVGILWDILRVLRIMGCFKSLGFGFFKDLIGILWDLSGFLGSNGIFWYPTGCFRVWMKCWRF